MGSQLTDTMSSSLLPTIKPLLISYALSPPSFSFSPATLIILPHGGECDALTAAIIWDFVPDEGFFVAISMTPTRKLRQFNHRTDALREIFRYQNPNRGDARTVSSVNDGFFRDSNQQWNQSQSSEDPTCFSNPINGDGGSQVILDGTMRFVSLVSALKELAEINE